MTGDENTNAAMQEPGNRIVALRESIRQSFPAQPYNGRVTHNDDNLDDPELDEDIDLYEGLKGRRWTEVSATLLRNVPSGYFLLTDEAFLAFFPAWLMHSLDDTDTKDEVRDYVALAFSSTTSQFRLLNPEQRLTVRLLLTEFVQHGSPGIRRLAAESLELINWFEKNSAV